MIGIYMGHEASKNCSYPSYVDLDRFIDVARLRSLDGYLNERLQTRLQRQAADNSFYTGPFVLQDAGLQRPGSQMVYLSRSTREDTYYDLDNPLLWRHSEESREFSELMDFIATLPFKATARMLIMYDPSGRAVTAHRDHDVPEVCHEFIWFRTNFAKPIYMLNPTTSQKVYVHSHSAWFDTVNQYHGADASEGFSFSIRVDGIFTDAFRALIPDPGPNRAAAPAAWAASRRQGACMS
jgi:hypothetical protein